MATTLVNDDDYGKLAIWYYTHFPDEPISAKASLTAEKPAVMPKTSLLSLLESVLTAKKGTDLIVVSHGYDKGMIMPIMRGMDALATTQNLEILMGGDSKKIEAFGAKPDAMADLLAKAEAVRKIGLGHVAFRGCSIGSQKRNLEILRDFLGAADVSAASVLSTFGKVKPAIPRSQSHFNQLWTKYKDRAHLFTGSSGRAIFWRGPHPKAKLDDLILLYIEKKEVLHEWFQALFLPGTSSATATKLMLHTPVHYLRRDIAVMPLDGRSDVTILGYADFIASASDPS